ncbi:33666_t:CDS:1, partial [Gigaspora margarita]
HFIHLVLLTIIPHFVFSTTIPLTFYCNCYAPSAASFNTSIANIALKASAQQGPCVEISSSGEYSNRSTFTVSKITSAKPICFGDVASVQDSRGSSVWFLSQKGWI